MTPRGRARGASAWRLPFEAVVFACATLKNASQSDANLEWLGGQAGAIGVLGPLLRVRAGADGVRVQRRCDDRDHEARADRRARPVGAHDEVGLFITEENDTPQMIEKYLVKTGL